MIVQALLIVYISLPSLAVGAAAGFSGAALFSGFGLFALNAASCAVIFRIRKRRPLIISLVVFLLVVSAASLAAGKWVHWSFLRLFCNLSPGPLLTVIFVVIFKLSRPNDFRKLSIGINRIIILLISFSSILIMLKIRYLINTAFTVSVQDIFFGFYEAMNYLPAIYFLRILRNSSANSLEMKGGRFWCRNEEITGLFSKTEIFILSKIVGGTRRILCRDIVCGLNEDYECTPENCKASICPAYAVIYRNVKSLDKKLENLGIGMIASPENKRYIVTEGWMFVHGEEVRISRGRRSPINIPAISDVLKKSNTRLWSLAAAIFICVSGAFLLAREAGTIFQPSVISGLLCTAILIQPMVGPGKNFFKRGLLSVFLLLTASLFLIPPLGEAAALFLFVRGFGILVLCLLLRFSAFEKKTNLDSIKDNAPNILFWLIWFYSVILSVYIEPVFPGLENLYSTSGGLLSYFFNRLLLFSLFAVSVGFFSLSRKSLDLINDGLIFNNKPLPLGLSRINMNILREMAIKDGESLRCNEILKMINPEEAENCTDDCKPSVCSNYQNIYKRIQTIRKYIQTAGIGTIVSPERKASAHMEGWHLVLYEDVYLKL